MKFRILGFSKSEQTSVLIILSVLSIVIAANMRIAVRKARDAQRKADIRTISDALVKYQDEFGSFPLSGDDGSVIACNGELNEEGVLKYKSCRWGWEGLGGKVLPPDPQHGKGARYRYISNTKRFQIYAALESVDEPEYSLDIEARSIPCGDRVCNFGLAYGDTPLDKSIEEYENEMRAKEIEELKEKGLYVE